MDPLAAACLEGGVLALSAMLLARLAAAAPLLTLAAAGLAGLAISAGGVELPRTALAERAAEAHASLTAWQEDRSHALSCRMLAHRALASEAPADIEAAATCARP